jgi:hypothetical protein
MSLGYYCYGTATTTIPATTAATTVLLQPTSDYAKGMADPCCSVCHCHLMRNDRVGDNDRDRDANREYCWLSAYTLRTSQVLFSSSWRLQQLSQSIMIDEAWLTCPARILLLYTVPMVLLHISIQYIRCAVLYSTYRTIALTNMYALHLIIGTTPPAQSALLHPPFHSCSLNSLSENQIIRQTSLHQV